MFNACALWCLILDIAFLFPLLYVLLNISSFNVSLILFCFYISFFSLAVNGNWSFWSNWTDCSQPCGGGIMSRNRTCNNPMTASGGTFCSGLPNEQQDCNTVSCASFFSSNGLKAFNNLFVRFIDLPFLVIFNPCFVFQFEARF
jgi:hypothetical protein